MADSESPEAAFKRRLGEVAPDAQIHGGYVVRLNARNNQRQYEFLSANPGPAVKGGRKLFSRLDADGNETRTPIKEQIDAEVARLKAAADKKKNEKTEKSKRVSDYLSAAAKPAAPAEATKSEGESK